MSSARHNYLHIFVFIDSFFLLDAIRPVPSGTYDFEGSFVSYTLAMITMYLHTNSRQ